MGSTPPNTGGLFSSINQKTAYEAFKTSGSFDPDTLYAQRDTMLAPYRNLRRLAGLGAVLGLLAVGTGMPVVGIVLLGGSVVLWRVQGRLARNIEAGYAQYVGLANGERPPTNVLNGGDDRERN